MSLKQKVLSGFIWNFCRRMGNKLISFVVTIILARMLTPEDYGLIALITVFTSIADLIIDSGFGSALIQKENADELDFSSIFYFKTALSVILFAVLYFAAPLIADFYQNPQLTSIIRWMNLRTLFSGIGSVQSAYGYRYMLFKRFFWSSLAATVASASVALVMVYTGFGVWALVAQILVTAIVTPVVSWFLIKWRPMFAFSWKRMKSLYSFGWKISLTSFITRMYMELRSLIIGKLYSPEDLGYYKKGQNFPEMVTDTFTNAIDSVLFPAISQKQQSVEAVKNITRLSLRTTSYIVMPMMVGLAVCAKPLVSILLTDKWLPSVPFLQIACFFHAVNPIQNVNQQAIKALGRSDIILKLEICKRIIGVGILLLVMNHGVLAIALSTIPVSIVTTTINTIPAIRLIDYKFKEQMLDILTAAGMSAIMACAIYPVHFLGLPAIPTLCLQVAGGALIYIALSVLLRAKSFYFIIDTLKNFRKKNKD